MLNAARAFLAALSPEQRAQATFDFADEERFTWHFTPVPRRGIPLKQLAPAQVKLAHAVISAGYSPAGAVKATTIMSLEQVLHDFEQPRRFDRDSDLYFLTLFGEPAPERTWGWRVEGHHLSLNVTLVDGQHLATTPSFFGANPAEVRQGPRAGLRVLAPEEDLARDLLASLDAGQRAQAIVDVRAPRDILTANHRRALHLGNAGLPAAALTAAQRERLMALLEEYAAALPGEVAAARMAGVTAAPPDELRFAWAGGTEPGEGHYYRIQGPTFLIEYDNTQNNANHIHTVWRDFAGDWGDDLLAGHYARSRHR